MKTPGYRVAVIGASSLLGKELLAVLEERDFPVAEMITVSGDAGESDLPIVDLSRGRRTARDFQDEIPEHFDFAFVSAPHQRLAAWMERAGRERHGPKGVRAVIDLCANVSQPTTGSLRGPLIDGPSAAAQASGRGKGLQVIAAPHAATLMIGALVSRLAARFKLRCVVAQIF